MRRVILIFLCLMLAAVFWWQGGSPGGAGMAGGIAGFSGGGEEHEFRIDIVDTAAEADARHEAILSRYAKDDEARTWVDACLSDGAGASDGDNFRRSWEFACWQSWDDLQRRAP